MDGVLFGRNGKASPNAFFGFIDGTPVGALATWTLAGECLALADERPGEAVTVFLDSPGQAPTFHDERVMLSEYVAHLALALLSDLRQQRTSGDAASARRRSRRRLRGTGCARDTRGRAPGCQRTGTASGGCCARAATGTDSRIGVEDYLRAGVIDTLI